MCFSESLGFWQGMAPFIYKDEVFMRTSQEVTDILNFSKTRTPPTILDLGCGSGRHALEFAKRQCFVVACDKYSSLYKEAQKKAEEDRCNIEWQASDMRHFCRPGSFDLVINLFFSFGFFANPEDDLAVLQNIFTSLKPGGKCVLEVVGSEIVLKCFQWRMWEIIDEKTALLLEREFLYENRWLNETYVVFSNENSKTYHFGFRLYGAEELSRLLLDKGFVNITVAKDFCGSSYDEAAQRLVITAEKPTNTSIFLRC